MADLPKLEDVLDLAKQIESEVPKSKQGIKAIERRARKNLVKIRNLCHPYDASYATGLFIRKRKSSQMGMEKTRR